MTNEYKPLPKWILIVSGLIALLELGVSLALWFSPKSVVENVDLNATGVEYVIQMWAARQFALGFIFAYATYKKSASMLTIAYIFLLVMFFGDFIVGISQKENTLVFSALVMIIFSGAMIYAVNKRR